MHTVDAVQLMVEDDVTYKQWVVKFSEVIRYVYPEEVILFVCLMHMIQHIR